ncbi:MAG TPA: DUF6600 domain-containing protein [Pyrinomonadaceae bacterium]|nr:DUF6600 domain-containing protein [Pyrinomonadaceae bacterium]
MRDSKTLLTLALLLLSILTTTAAASSPALAATPTTAAFDEEAEDDYEETARVVRVSMLSGDVSLRRAGSDKWEKAGLNLPLVEGDRLATGADARLEIQIDARNFLRLGQYATLDIVTLRDEGVALSLPEGTATLRLAGFDSEREYFEIDAPKTTLAAEQKGSYRLDVAQNGNVRVTVREGGRARLYSETSGFTLRDGRSAELTYNNNASEDGDWELSAARGFDTWDTWVDERERYLAARLRYEGRDRYYDKYVWGAEELDAYGDWVNSSEYGYVWRPHTTVINHYNNWAPYRYGSWRWCPPYGWTWVGDEPWGWAPYHYGRWVYVNNYWGWAPRGYARYGRRSWWRPALVAFVNINIGGGGRHYGGDHVAWYPLGYHQRDPRSNFYRRAVNRALDQRRIANLDRVNPVYQRAVTTLPAREFGKNMTRGKPAPQELASRAITTDPLRGKLPFRPTDSELVKGGADGSGNGGGNGGGNDGLTPVVRERRGDTLVIRNPTDPTRTFTERRTGAATRRPGLALDGELRRGRIYNNREPRSSKGEKGGGDTVNVGDGTGERRPGRSVDRGNNGERGTGAFERPARGNAPRDGGADGTHVGSPAVRRPERQADPDAGTFRPLPNVTDGRTGRKVKADERPPDDGNATTPAPEYRRERPMPRPEARDERARPVEHERPAPEVYRPRPEVREERRAPREERRPEPRPERSAPPREEPSVPREERRSSPPPQQREERRADPPREQRSAPPASPIRSKSKTPGDIDN